MVPGANPHQHLEADLVGQLDEDADVSAAGEIEGTALFLVVNPENVDLLCHERSITKQQKQQ